MGGSEIRGAGYPFDSGRLNTLWLHVFEVCKEIVRSARLGPWIVPAASGNEIAPKQRLLLLHGVGEPAHAAACPIWSHIISRKSGATPIYRGYLSEMDTQLRAFIPHSLRSASE